MKLSRCERAPEETAQAASPRAKKSLGQNFLRDGNIARKIVAALRVEPGDSVLEIGPGPGALTGILQECRPARLVLVEKDAHWAAERMRQGRAAMGERCAVILADALTLPWERFSAPWKFIGNLPYNVASPLMWEIFSRAGGLTRAVFMVQKEVGLRLVAGPGSSAYGALSVWVQSHVQPRLEFIVPPQVFRPRPKVDSAVVSFTPGAGAYDFEPAALALTLKRCFQMRRKQLGSIARAWGKSGGDLESLGIRPEQRPETLRPEDFHALSRANVFTGKD